MSRRISMPSTRGSRQSLTSTERLRREKSVRRPLDLGVRIQMSFLPSVVHAEYRDGFRIQLTFNDGTAGTVDFRSWLDGPIFEPLRELAYFRRFFLEGGTVSWPNGAA